MPPDPAGPDLTSTCQALVQFALDQGASAASVVDSAEIVVDDRLAGLCRPPGCPNYGLAASCPPHVGGPAALRERLRTCRKAVVFKFDVPRAMLMDNRRRPLFTALHDLAAGIEAMAVARGFSDARAFAGGSCKTLFCADHAGCPVVDAGGACRWPDRARPSMSGYGIDVFKLMATAGWAGDAAGGAATSDGDPMSAIVGMVLVG